MVLALTRSRLAWRRYLIDSALALAGVLLVTGVIAFFHLYPRISTISLSYLLVVLALAALRDRFAPILASLLAFFAFNYFLVPPLYTLQVARPDDLVALIVFLATAIITGQLASALRARAEEALRREQETRILYDLSRAVNNEDNLSVQFATVTRAVVNVFAAMGVRDCALLLPGADGILRVQARAERDACDGTELEQISKEEQAAAAWGMQNRQTVDVYDGKLPAQRAEPTAPHFVVRASTHPTTPFVRLVPLLSNNEAIGVLRLVMEGAPFGSESVRRLGADRSQPGSTPFFWTLVDQITYLIVRERLRSTRQHVQALQETDTLRAALLSSVSHDLRTPLATMKAATSSLLANELHWDEETRHSFLLSIERELDRLNRLVGNLLDLSRIEGNALKPEKEWYLIDEIIHDVVERLQPGLANRPVLLNVPGDLPPVEVDYLALDQVLTNLIENAIYYTPAGSPIEISAQVKDGQMQIVIADRGPGIPPSDLERIFDKFYRVQSGQSGQGTHRSGSGLGLAVSRGLIEAHGGSISAENREGGGALFRVYLPVDLKEQVLETREKRSDE